MLEISRRGVVLNAAGALAAFGLNAPVAFIGAARAQGVDDLFRRHKVGDIEITSLVDGYLEAPHREGWIRNASVEQAKAALRASGLNDAHVVFPFTVTLLKMADRLVLFDTGTGGFPLYGPRTGMLLKSMAAAGFDPKDVKTILISHLHADHINGLMDKETGAQVFPHAEIIVPEAELKWWTRPEVDAMDLGPTRKGLAQRIRTTLATWKNVRPIDGEVELIPGVRTVAAPGHSPAQVAHHVSSGGKQLLITADVCLMPPLFAKNPDWQVGFDQDPLLAVATRKRIFDRVVADKLMITGTHWLLPNVGTLAKDGSGYAFTPAA